MPDKETDKKLEPNTAGSVCGYLRVSRIVFPPECQTSKERSAFVETMRQVRKAELCRDAFLQGDTITEWYDDLGVSGRGEFLPRRVAFARARSDAKVGRLRVLYARDLSRLFRNVVQQELWFVEMEELGVVVHAQDLPFASDPATRRLLRQQMGIIHEYVSSRMGTLMKERTRTRILSGLGMGLHRSRWGLHYNSERKAFDYEPVTADKVRLVYETYVASNGSAGRTATLLNLMLALGHSRATATPRGHLWDHRSVLKMLDCPSYRRVIKYGDVLVPAPERIPEVVSPDLIARVDALLIPRHQQFKAISDNRKAGLVRFTYSQLLRCGYCGSVMRAKPNYRGGGEGSPKWVSYVCLGASTGRGCSVSNTIQQSRLNALVGEGLKLAFQSLEGASSLVHDEPLCESRDCAEDGSSPSASSLPVSSLSSVDAACQAREEMLQRLDRKRERYLELFACGLIRDEEELERCLVRVQRERQAFEAPRVQEREASAVGASVVPVPEAAVLHAELLQTWPTDWEQLMDAPKHDLLVRLRASISVRILPHQTKNPSKTETHRFNAGRLTLALEVPALGLVGLQAIHLAETDEQLENYWQWRSAFLREGHALSLAARLQSTGTEAVKDGNP